MMDNNDDDDEDLRKAIEASLQDQQKDERQLQETIRRSRLDFFEQKQGTKRKAEDTIVSKASKRRPSPEISPPRLTKRVSESASVIPQIHPPKAQLTFPDGALRITRTPGRSRAKNCVNLEDVIQGKDLVAACCFSFFIGGDELYRHLPLSHSSDAVPIYIGRDANVDPMTQEACIQNGITSNTKLNNKQVQAITPTLQELYRMNYGKNYHAFYAWSPGSSHSKILLLVYPDFARLVITSCNLMDIDTVLGDNHWYIHDLPKLSSGRSSSTNTFEEDFFNHLQALNTPETFLSSIRGKYDYSKVKVHLVTSAPGVCSGAKAEKHGLLRLRRVVKDLDLDLPKQQDRGKLQLDLCAASIGNLSIKWLSNFRDCALGEDQLELIENESAVSKLRIFYPTVGDVRSADQRSQDAASNIGCHTRPWEKASPVVQELFHHYESKDNGRLFHQKLILPWNENDPKALPYFVYVGSANLSQSAWGALEPDKKKNQATCDTKLIKISNFECGVVVPGYLIDSLLEKGTKDWQTGIVPFVQTGEKYDLSKDRPWNDPRWVQDYQPDWTG